MNRNEYSIQNRWGPQSSLYHTPSYLLDDSIADTHVSGVINARRPQPKNVRTVSGVLLLVIAPLYNLMHQHQQRQRTHNVQTNDSITMCYKARVICMAQREQLYMPQNAASAPQPSNRQSRVRHPEKIRLFSAEEHLISTVKTVSTCGVQKNKSQKNRCG